MEKQNTNNDYEEIFYLSKSKIRRNKLSVDLNVGIDHLYEPEASKEARCSSEDKEEEGEDGGVAKVEERGNEGLDVKSCEEVKDASTKHIESGGPRSEERPPPPVIVFGAELEVTHDNSDLSASDN